MKYLANLIGLCLIVNFNISQTQGTLYLDDVKAQEGYTLIAPLNYDTTYLVNNCGEVINKWASSYPPGDEVFLTDQGNLWRAGRTTGINLVGAGGRGGIIELFDWDGNILWSYERCDQFECMHHDFRLLPNGNLLILIWDKYEKNIAVNNGANPDSITTNGVWSEYLVEITPVIGHHDSALTVWEWHAWDHLVQDYNNVLPNYGSIGQSPERIDINYAQHLDEDWLHINGIDYNSSLDQIIMSVPTFDEFWIIDHSTTTAQAVGSSGGNSGKGGDLLYRWGNPMAYQSGTISDKQLFFQHNPHWVPGNKLFGDKIILFNNNNEEGGNLRSSVFVIDPQTDINGNYLMNAANQYLPDSPFYQYDLPTDLFSTKVSGVQVQDNDNLLICAGTNGTLLEIDNSEDEVWKYKSPVSPPNIILSQDSVGISNWVFRAYKYTNDFPGFTGKDMTPGLPIELNSNRSYCNIVSLNENYESSFILYPNPAFSYITVESKKLIEKALIYNLNGHLVLQESLINKNKIDIGNLTQGFYFITFFDGDVKLGKTVKIHKQ